MASKKRLTKSAQNARSKALARDHDALRLREQGHTYREIAEALGFAAESHARRAVKRRLDALARDCNEAAEDVRRMMIAELDLMRAGLAEKAASGDEKAVLAVLRCRERESALGGYDSPKLLKIEVARELEANLEKLKAGLPADVYERVLGVLAGEHGEAEAGGDSGSEAPSVGAEDDDAAE